MDNKQNISQHTSQMKRLSSFLKNQNLWIIIHDTLQDSLVLAIFSLGAFMTIESLMPGFISSHINLAKVSFGIVMLFFATIQIGKVNSISVPQKSMPQWLISAVLLWLLILIIISLLKFPAYAIIATVTLTAIILFLFFQIIQKSHN